MRRGLALSAGLTVAILVIIAWPVVVAPGERIYGAEIVGRHHDPFTVMRQMAGTGAPGPYRQPATDDLGWLLARALSPVAAYNVLVLITFPLTAAATYGLTRYLSVPHAGALAAALFFTFAPIRLAHAAYHPHIVQSEWLPAYLLALFAAIDKPTLVRLALLVATGAGFALSNFYGGLIALVITPVAIASYGITSTRAAGARGPLVVAATLLVAGTIAAGAARVLYPDLISNPYGYGFPVSAVAEHSARWWAYLTPPVTHPVFGLSATGRFAGHGVTRALVEQQVYLSYALLVLSAAGLSATVRRWGVAPHGRVIAALAIVAMAAYFASLAPVTLACSDQSWALGCHLHDILPMFRAYARFAFVVHLGVAIVAGCGLAWLIAARNHPASRRYAIARGTAACLLAIATFEYWPLPARARDVLPTEGHRWLARLPGELRVFDCVQSSAGDSNTAWLMGHRLGFLGGTIASCRDPYIGTKLAALGYSHILVRRPDRTGSLDLLDRPSSGLDVAADFRSARVYAVGVDAPPVVALGDGGFLPYEYDADRAWRWMGGGQAHWQVENTTAGPLEVSLELRLESIHEPRLLTVSIDDAPAQVLHVSVRPSSYLLGPWPLAPGPHRLTFEAGGEPFQPSAEGISRDSRELTIAFHGHAWISAAPSVQAH
jgi:hypothetical protein